MEWIETRVWQLFFAGFRFHDRHGMSSSTMLPLHCPHSSRLHSAFHHFYFFKAYFFLPMFILFSLHLSNQKVPPLRWGPGRSTSLQLPPTSCARPGAGRNGLRPMGPWPSPAVHSASLPAMRSWTAGRYAVGRKSGRQGDFCDGVTLWLSVYGLVRWRFLCSWWGFHV